jgi:hypothetical protein
MAGIVPGAQPQGSRNHATSRGVVKLIQNSEHCRVASAGAAGPWVANANAEHRTRCVIAASPNTPVPGAAEAILPALLSTLLTFSNLGSPFSDEVLDSGPWK